MIFKRCRNLATCVFVLSMVVGCGDDGASPDASLGDGGLDAGPTCAAGTFDDDDDASTPCTAWTECVAGEYALAGSASEDRTCVPCVNSFSTLANAPECTLWTVCVAGEFVSAAGSELQDQTCSPCANGSFSTTLNAESCDEFTPCEPGTFVSEEGTTSADQACATCETGTFSVVQDALDCSAHTRCVPGEYLDPAGTATTDAACTSCAMGTFSDSDNAPRCAPWSTCDLFLATPGTDSMDAVCGEPCADMSDGDGDGIPDTCGVSVLVVEGFGAGRLEAILVGWGFSVVRVDGAALVAEFDYSPYDVVALLHESSVANVAGLVAANEMPGGPGIVVHRADTLMPQLGLGDLGSFQSGASSVASNLHYVTAFLPLGPVDLGYTFQSETRMPIPGTTTPLIGSPAPSLVVHNTQRRLTTPYYGHEEGMPWTAEGAQVTWRSYIWAAFAEFATD
ncbi:MAG: hypothetical protein AB8H86_08635 [Polyangiales bacterium]